MYTVVKMLNKIDSPSKQPVVVIYMVVQLVNSRHLAHLQLWLQKQQKGHSNPSGEWPAM